MSWKHQKKQIDLEKAIGIDSTSSFGSVKQNVIVLPPKAHHSGSPTSPNFSQTGSSPQFSSSFPTSEVRERKMQTFVRRHAFIILVMTLLAIGAVCAALALILHRRQTQGDVLDVLPGDLSGNTPQSSVFSAPVVTSTSSL